MSEKNKGHWKWLHIRMSRKNLLLLSKVIEQGLLAKEKNGEYSILQIMDQSSVSDLTTMSEELLQKGGLTALNEKLQSLSGKTFSDGK